MGERSGLCHGPLCRMPIDPRGASEYFCSDGCQERWHAGVNGGSPVGVIQRDGLYVLETDFDRDEAWQSIMRRYAWLVDAETVRIRPRPGYHTPPAAFDVTRPQLAVDESLPPDEVQFRDPKTGATLARITNIGEPNHQPIVDSWWRRLLRRWT